MGECNDSVSGVGWWSLQMRRVSKLEICLSVASNRRSAAISISRLETVMSVSMVASQ